MSSRRGGFTTGNLSTDNFVYRFLWGLFGDRIGLVIFIGGLLFFGVYWRVGFFSTDNYAVVNGLIALADGHLYIDRIIFGPPSGASPGMHVVGDRLYARNYGLITAALPVYLVLQALNAVTDLRIVVVSAWCVGLLSLILLLATRTTWNRERVLTGGSVVVLGIFALNLIDARLFPQRLLAVFALQIVTAIAAALTGVVLYRLGTDMYDRRVGVFAGCLVLFASPVGFWATIPKRHSLTAFVAIAAIYAFYRSRVADSVRVETRFRAVAYAGAAITAWIHAAEGLVLLSALVSVDIFSARSNHPRRIVVIGCVFLIALTPFLATNVVISDDPLTPPRELSSYNGADDVVVVAVADSDRQEVIPSFEYLGASERENPNYEDSSNFGGVDSIRPGSVVSEEILVGSGTRAVEQFAQFSAMVTTSIKVVTDHRRMTGVFIRGGFLESVPIPKAINLTVLESMPVLGVILALPVMAGGWFRRNHQLTDVFRDEVIATDALVVVYGLLVTMLYLDRLPVHHMFTVRYLHALYPLGGYLVIRLPAVRRVISSESELLAGVYLAMVGLGIPVFILMLDQLVQVQGEAVQLYGLIALGTACLVGGWALYATTTNADEWLGAVILGSGMGIMTIYLVVSGLGIFAYTPEFLLPISEMIAGYLRFVNPWESLWEVSADLYQLSP